MPYDVVGNAAGGRGGRGALSGGFGPGSGGGARGAGYVPGGGRGRRRYAGGGGGCNIVQTVYCGFCVCLLGGLACLITGMGRLLAATTDTRGHKLQQWSDAMNPWADSREAAFEALKPTVATAVGASPTALAGTASTVTPSTFGESSWSTSKIKTPASLTAYKYSGTASCPGGKNLSLIHI